MSWRWACAAWVCASAARARVPCEGSDARPRSAAAHDAAGGSAWRRHTLRPTGTRAAPLLSRTVPARRIGASDSTSPKPHLPPRPTRALQRPYTRALQRPYTATRPLRGSIAVYNVVHCRNSNVRTQSVQPTSGTVFNLKVAPITTWNFDALSEDFLVSWAYLPLAFEFLFSQLWSRRMWKVEVYSCGPISWAVENYASNFTNNFVFVFGKCFIYYFRHIFYCLSHCSLDF